MPSGLASRASGLRPAAMVPCKPGDPAWEGDALTLPCCDRACVGGGTMAPWCCIACTRILLGTTAWYPPKGSAGTCHAERGSKPGVKEPRPCCIMPLCIMPKRASCPAPPVCGRVRTTVSSASRYVLSTPLGDAVGAFLNLMSKTRTITTTKRVRKTTMMTITSVAIVSVLPSVAAAAATVVLDPDVVRAGCGAGAVTGSASAAAHTLLTSVTGSVSMPSFSTATSPHCFVFLAARERSSVEVCPMSRASAASTAHATVISFPTEARTTKPTDTPPFSGVGGLKTTTLL